MAGVDANLQSATLDEAVTDVSDLKAAGNQLATAANFPPLNVTPNAAALRASLDELQAWRSGALAASSTGISAGVATGIGVGAGVGGALLGGLIGHAIGAGLIFAGEAAEARETGRSKKKRKRRR